MTRTSIAWLVCYVAWMALLLGGLFWARQTAFRVYGGVAAQADWNQFRDDMARLARDGPVERRPPKSPEPPALVLMRDYFGVSLVGAVVFGSLLFAMLMGATRGAFTRDFEPQAHERDRGAGHGTAR